MRARGWALLLLLAGPAAAAVPLSAAWFGSARDSFVAVGAGARPVGMGEAFTAVADDATAVTWNPGGLGRLGGIQAVAAYDALGDGLSLSYAAGALPVGPGVAGAAASVLDSGSFTARDANGDSLGTQRQADAMGAAAYGVPNPGWLGVPGGVGIGVEAVRESGGATLAGVNVGGLAEIRPALTLGWAVLHVGPALQSFALPALARLGAAVTLAPYGVLAVDGTREVNGSRWTAAAGVEFVRLDPVTLRAGYVRTWPDDGLSGLTSLTAGFGLRLGRLRLDYAYQPFGDLVINHRVALSYAGVTRESSRGPAVVARPSAVR